MYRVLCGLLLTTFLCTACGGVPIAEEVEQIQTALTAMTEGTVEAKVLCSDADSMTEYQLSCLYEAEGSSRVVVLAPEELAGIGASFDGEKRSLHYDTLCLPAGTASKQVCAADCLPRFLEALHSGYLSEYGTATWQDTDCLTLRFETEGGTIAYTAWLSQEDWRLMAGEIAENGKTVIRMEFTETGSHVIIKG